MSDRIDAINADIMTQPHSANRAELDGFNLPGILTRIGRTDPA